MNWDYFTLSILIKNLSILTGFLIGIYTSIDFSKDSDKEFIKNKFNIFLLFISFLVCLLVSHTLPPIF